MQKILAAVVALSMVASAQAATLVWTSAEPTWNPTEVINTGNVLAVARFAPKTVNGVSFVQAENDYSTSVNTAGGVTLTAGFGNDGYGGGYYQTLTGGGALSAYQSFASIPENSYFDAAVTLTYSGLTTGNTYTVQMWISPWGSGTNYGPSVDGYNASNSYTSTVFTTDSGPGYRPTLFQTTFVADGESQVIQVASGPNNYNAGAQVGAISLTSVPEPATMGMLVLGGMAALIRRRNRG